MINRHQRRHQSRVIREVIRDVIRDVITEVIRVVLRNLTGPERRRGAVGREQPETSDLREEIEHLWGRGAVVSMCMQPEAAELRERRSEHLPTIEERR
jgi:hypothetical protein